MFDMGFLELALIAGIGLLVLGPERLPVVARTVGRYVGMVRRFAGNFQRQIEQETRLEELNKKIMDETRGQRFTNNDGSVTGPDGQVRRSDNPAETDPGAVTEAPESAPGASDTSEEPGTPSDADTPPEDEPSGRTGRRSTS